MNAASGQSAFKFTHHRGYDSHHIHWISKTWWRHFALLQYIQTGLQNPFLKLKSTQRHTIGTNRLEMKVFLSIKDIKRATKTIKGYNWIVWPTVKWIQEAHLFQIHSTDDLSIATQSNSFHKLICFIIFLLFLFFPLPCTYSCFCNRIVLFYSCTHASLLFVLFLTYSFFHFSPSLSFFFLLFFPLPFLEVALMYGVIRLAKKKKNKSVKE